MAARSKKRAAEGDIDVEGGGELTFSRVRRMEALGVVLLIFASALCFALMSYDPLDRAGTQNLVGPAGRLVSRILLGGIGVMGFVVAIFGVFGAGAVLLGRARWPRPLAITSAFGITVAAAVLAELIAGQDAILGEPSGGAIGSALAGSLVSVVGPAGAALFAVGLLLLSVLGVADVSFGSVLRDTGAFIRFCALEVKGAFDRRNAAREAAAEHEMEIYRRERERLEAEERAREERERKLKEKLEEKARLAIEKERARAEAKALAKLGLWADEPEQGKKKKKGKAEEAEAPAAEDGLAPDEDVREPRWAEDGEAEIAPDALALPGPAAEPEIIIGPTNRVEPDADAPDGSDAEHADAAKSGDAGESDEALEAGAGEPPAAEAGEKKKRSRKKKGSKGAAPADAALDEIDEEVSAEKAAAEDEDADDEQRAAADEEVAEGSSDAPGSDPDHLLGPEIVPMKVSGADPDLLNDEAELEREDDAVGQPRVQVERAKPVYELPPIRLLNYDAAPARPIDGERLRARATRLEEKLRTYGVEGRVTAIRPGPVVTTYEYQPAPGVKVAKIANLSDDIAMSMEAQSVRIIAPIPGKGVVGIELPNEERDNVYLKEIVAHDRFTKSKSLLTLALGKDAEGEAQVRDLAKMPHVLVAGTTGSGKSVAVNAMILSILYKATPDQVKFIMVDPKMLELSLYDGIPHLLLPVVTDPKKASLALQWAVDEMERRYQLLSDFKVRNIEGFNKKLAALRDQRKKSAGEPASIEPSHDEPSSPPTMEELVPGLFDVEEKGSTPPGEAGKGEPVQDPCDGKDLPEDLPYIVVLIDEFADLMCVASRDVEASVQRLAQKARAAGIHVMLATQRPSTDVITGVIKNNFPCRMSFRVASRHDSATIINAPGAENLLGMGDMLCLGAGGANGLVRIHGAFVSEEEVQRVAEFWKAQGKPNYDPAILKPRASEDDEGEGEDFEHDEMYDQAVQIVTETKKASISALQRRLRVGYNRAARMIEMMEKEGIVSAASGPKGERDVLVQAIPP